MLLKRILTYSVLSLATVCTFFANVSVDTDHTGSILASVSLDGESIYAATAEECKKDGKILV